MVKACDIGDYFEGVIIFIKVVVSECVGDCCMARTTAAIQQPLFSWIDALREKEQCYQMRAYLVRVLLPTKVWFTTCDFVFKDIFINDCTYIVVSAVHTYEHEHAGAVPKAKVWCDSTVVQWMQLYPCCYCRVCRSPVVALTRNRYDKLFLTYVGQTKSLYQWYNIHIIKKYMGYLGEVKCSPA